ncbi:hypothetical protein [Cohnella yongneupensis]|uniref:Uncharacterized protein n=1 Tax=Cohnella yongneupensis TaxID=425006 RepID=A0ABW0QV68_9BACL
MEAVKKYLELSDITQPNSVHQIWARTQGHPLTLSLLVSTMLVGSSSQTFVPDENDVFAHVAAAWLQEVPDPDMKEIVEAASVLRHFNHELLNYALGRTVTGEQFRSLISYSFVQRVDRGWILHDLLRDAIGLDFRRRSPDFYNQLWLRSVSYYSDKIKRSAKIGMAAWENAEILFYIGNYLIQFLLNRQSISYSMEQLHPANWAEAEQYMEQRHATAKDGNVVYVDPSTNEQATYLMTAKESLNILNQIRLKELYELDPACVKLIRNEKGNIYGLIVSIPINELTLDYLKTRPISAAYFRSAFGSREHTIERSRAYESRLFRPNRRCIRLLRSERNAGYDIHVYYRGTTSFITITTEKRRPLTTSWIREARKFYPTWIK